MSFTIVPVDGGHPIGGFSLPDMVSFAVADNGAGGQILINGLGVNDPTVSHAVDLRTLFINAGLLFNSQALVSGAFRLLSDATDGGAMARFVKTLDINMYPLGTPAGDFAGMPYVNYLHSLSGGPAGTPYLALAGPGQGGEGAPSGLWRVELKLRHTVTD